MSAASIMRIVLSMQPMSGMKTALHIQTSYGMRITLGMQAVSVTRRGQRRMAIAALENVV